MVYLRAALGIAFFCAVAWLISSERRRVPWRIVVFGLLAQLVLGWTILNTLWGRELFESLGLWVAKLIGMTDHGSQLVFGRLADPEAGPWGLVFAFKALTTIIFFSALMSILYHLGVMQVVVWAIAKVLSALLGVSGAESMSIAANIFCGQAEAPLVVKPYIPRMTDSELMALMTGGFATIAGSVMAVYMGIVGPQYAPHLLSASVMAAPAAFVMAKLMRPETEQAVTAGRVELRIEREASNLIEAAANGTADGLKLWLNVIAMLIAFVALIHLIDWPLGWLGERLELEGGLSLSRIFGWVFAPVAWLIGVEGWRDSQLFGSLLGVKIAVNEFVAYTQLAQMQPDAAGGAGPAFETVRSAKMATYALCGFANFASIGIQIGALTPLAPNRKADIARTALKAMVAGAFASCMTAAVAGMFL
ncbi:MAG TPA: nucleoside transporter C-terminal domain-containing protein [Planctomycetota bacterium]|nr:nucleoside transporter C-terminal domain-containing protein [Planctomycetota bacterium]